MPRPGQSLEERIERYQTTWINSNVLFENSFVVRQCRRVKFVKDYFDGVVPQTMRRWIKEGRKSYITGEWVQLEAAIDHRGRLVTSREALGRFLERLNGNTDGALENRSPRELKRRQKQQNPEQQS